MADTFKPTAEMAAAARKALKIRDSQPPSNKGMTRVGLTRARQLIDREPLSLDTVKRMYSFFSRHEVDKQSDSWKEGDSKAEQAWLGWGGDAGFKWSKQIVEREAKANMALNKIVEREGEYCVISEDGTRSFGCFATRDDAEHRLGQIEGFKGNQVLVNFNMKVNRDMIRRTTRSGDEFIIIRSATLPDNVIMNGGLYPANEIEAGYQSLNGTLAPLGHPQDENGDFIPAASPYAIDHYYIGASNENVRRDAGRVWLDKAINVRVAMQSDKGKRLLDRIAQIEAGNGQPIHTSTGVFLKQIHEPGMLPTGEEYEWIASEMRFDHDAILLDEPGAATPNQGVGIAVNSKGEQYLIMNEMVGMPAPDEEEDDDNPAEEMTEELAKSMFRKFLEFMGFAPQEKQAYNAECEYSLTANEGDPMKDKMIARLKKAGKYEDGMSDDEVMNAYDKLMKDGEEKQKGNSADVVAAINAALAPMVEKIDALEAKVTANEQAEKAAHVEAVVNAGLLDKETAETMEANALAKLAANCNQSGSAHFLNTNFATKGDKAEFTDGMPE